jgi:hypothetical protein
MIHTFEMNDADLQHLRLGLAILFRGLPEWARWVLHVFTAAVYDPSGCDHPQAQGCTWTRYGVRTIVFKVRPSAMSPTQVAEFLRHESEHLFIRADGTFVMNAHTCRDCTDPAQRAADPIYQNDAHFRPSLEAAWQHLIRAERIPVTSPEPTGINWGVVVGWSALGLLLGAEIAAAATADKKSRRHRRKGA